MIEKRPKGVKIRKSVNCVSYSSRINAFNEQQNCHTQKEDVYFKWGSCGKERTQEFSSQETSD